MPVVLVTGATGFIGSSMVRDLRVRGHEVIALTRDEDRAGEAFGGEVWAVDRLSRIPGRTRIDRIVHLAGAPIFGKRWTAQRRKELIDSRTGVLRDLFRLIERLDHRPDSLVCASGVGFYGWVDPQQPLDETMPPEPGRFQSDLFVATEREALRAESLGVRVVQLRFGMVLGPEGGLYRSMAKAARVGAGVYIGNGTQPVAWIHLSDALALIRFAMEQPALKGGVNAVAPDTPSQSDFAAAMAATFDKQARVRVPAWLVKLGLGDRAELLLRGKRPVPAAALDAGFAFQFPTVKAAMADLAIALA